MIKDYLTPRTVELKFDPNQMLCSSPNEVDTENFTLVDEDFVWD